MNDVPTNDHRKLVALFAILAFSMMLIPLFSRRASRILPWLIGAVLRLTSCMLAQLNPTTGEMTSSEKALWITIVSETSSSVPEQKQPGGTFRSLTRMARSTRNTISTCLRFPKSRSETAEKETVVGFGVLNRSRKTPGAKVFRQEYRWDNLWPSATRSVADFAFSATCKKGKDENQNRSANSALLGI